LWIGRGATQADNPTWEKVWTDLTDGSGSGLDADLLDGQHGSYYYPASNPNGYTGDQDLSGYLLNTTDTLTGTLTIASNSTPLKFEETGYTGQGKYWRHVQDAGNLRFDSCTTGDGAFSPYVTALQLDKDGAVRFGGLGAGILKTNSSGVVSLDTNTYALASSVTGTNSNTNTGDQDLSPYATISASDGKYLLNTTDTLNGNLAVTGNFTGADFIQIREAGTTENSPYSIGYDSVSDFSHTGNDNVLRWLNHYGIGVHRPLGANSTGGRGLYMAGYFGLDFFTAGANRLHISQFGNVGIGTDSPQSKLHVSSGGATETTLIVGASGTLSNVSSRIFLNEGEAGATNSKDYGFSLAYDGSGAAYAPLVANTFGILRHNDSAGGAAALVINRGNGYVGINDNTPSYQLDVSGTIRATGDVIAYSDIRVKSNIRTIDSALDKVTSLRGVYFDRRDNKLASTGVIAQEIEKVLPEVVHTDSNGMKAVAYGNIVGVLIESIKELKAQIDELKSNK
jgi:hypothetical protein